MEKFKSIDKFEKFSLLELDAIKGGIWLNRQTNTTSQTSPGNMDYDSDDCHSNSFDTMAELNTAIEMGNTSGIAMTCNGEDFTYDAFLSSGISFEFTS